MNASSELIWPSELRCSADKKNLSIRIENGDYFVLSAELLRVESPSAEVQGHGSDQKKTPVNKGDVQILGIEPVGSYAVRLIFSDRHDTGIFSWVLLHDYGIRQEAMMADYQARVAALG
jgi:DUF971 family protein